MSAPRQRTLARAVALDGAGVHSGLAATLTLRPAEPGAGIRFRRADLPGAPEIPATLPHVVATELGTTLGANGVRVLTAEHVLAALAAREIDNAVLELSGPEPPIRDGSFRDYVRAVGDAGVVEQDAPARVIALEPAAVRGDAGTSYETRPSDRFRLSATIDFPHPAIGRQSGSFEITPEAFARELAPARTFGFRADADALHARGLARGASLENTVVLDEDGVMNEGLRFPDEFLRHKAGDLVGDLALLGARVRGHVLAERPSHKGNVTLARAIAARAEGAPRMPVIMDAAKILQHLPHRYPMLLVDRVVELEPGKRIVAIKNVTINEPYFQGHYPGHPIMPGVLQVEAMAQVGGLLLLGEGDAAGKLVYFMTLDNVKWRRPIVPGDQIVFEVELLQLKRNTCRMRGTGTVEGQLAVEAELMARIVDA